ncbi:hypothetical protein AAFH68_24740 [Flavobacterium sp. CGRL1]
MTLLLWGQLVFQTGRSFFTGSNTNSVISEVKVPVLCVPVDAKFKKIKTIGFTTRYREKRQSRT